MTSRSSTPFSVATILVAGLSVYANGFGELFVGLDARESLRDNVHIRSLWPLSEAISLPLWGATVVTEQHPSVTYRPTYSLILALTLRAFGLTPQAFFAVNLAIHIVAALMLFGVVRRTMRSFLPRYDVGNHTAPALAVALLWLVHPLQSESVTYFIQVSETTMGLFVFATMYAAIRAREATSGIPWSILSVLACAIAMGSKQTAVVTPLLVFLYDHTFAPPTGARRYRWLLYGALAVPVVVAVAWIAGDASKAVDGQWALSYFLTQPGVILHYLRLVVWPDQLHLYVNTDRFALTTLAQAVGPALILTILFGATVWAAWRRHWLGFVGGWFFLTLAPTSSVLPITDAAQEHRMYLPLAAVVVLVVLASRSALGYVAPGADRRRRRAVAAGILLGASVVALGIRTHARNADYQHEFAPYYAGDLHGAYRILADHAVSREDTLAREVEYVSSLLSAADSDPRAQPYAHFILGFARREAGDLAGARDAWLRVVELAPNFAYAHHHLGRVYRALGELDTARRHLERATELAPNFVYSIKELALVEKDRGADVRARELLMRALDIDPTFAEGHYELGILAVDRDDLDAAARHFREAIRHRRDLADAHYELGMVRKWLEGIEAGVPHFEAALQWRPEFAEAHLELGMARFEADEPELARRHFEEAIRLRPAFAEAHNELGIVLREAGDERAAAARFEEAMRLQPELPDPYIERGMLAAEQGELERAADLFATAIRLQSASADAYLGLGMVHHAQGDLDGATDHIERAIDLDPELIDAYVHLAAVLGERRRFEAAARRLEEALELDPEHTDALVAAGNLWLDRGEAGRARSYFRRALDVDPESMEALEGLSRAVSAAAATEGSPP